MKEKVHGWLAKAVTMRCGEEEQPVSAPRGQNEMERYESVVLSGGSPSLDLLSLLVPCAT